MNVHILKTDNKILLFLVAVFDGLTPLCFFRKTVAIKKIDDIKRRKFKMMIFSIEFNNTLKLIKVQKIKTIAPFYNNLYKEKI